MTSIFDLGAALRRIRPDGQLRHLDVRSPPVFVSDEIDPATIGPVLLDTCVYIDNGHGTLPIGARRLLASRGLVHISSVTGMEIAYSFGRLNPIDPRTVHSLRYLRDALARAPTHRVITASPADHVLAGILAGTLVRVQKLADTARRKMLLDCLIFASARRHGLTVLTANYRDFGLLRQLMPDGKVAFYQAHARH